MTRYDIQWEESGPKPIQHFCREWDERGGCYGTNPDHGYTWEEVREEIARWHADQAVYWRARKEEEEFPSMHPEEI